MIARFFTALFVGAVIAATLPVPESVAPWVAIAVAVGIVARDVAHALIFEE